MIRDVAKIQRKKIVDKRLTETGWNSRKDSSLLIHWMMLFLDRGSQANQAHSFG
jgi:hypothetical protein